VRSERPPLALLPVASSLSIEDRQLHASRVSKAHETVEHRAAQALETARKSTTKTAVKRKLSAAQTAPVAEQNSLFSSANAAMMELFDDDGDRDLENSSDAVLPLAPARIVNLTASAPLSANTGATFFEGISLKGIDMDALFDEDDD
jgi:hypothetical protein